MISDFTLIKKLGEGGFGHVFQARNTLDGKEYAIKVVRIKRDQNVVLREAQALAKLGEHLNITTYYHCWVSTEDIPDESSESTENCGQLESYSGTPDNSEYEPTENTSADNESDSTLVPWSRCYLYIQMGLYERTLHNWLSNRERPKDSYENLLRMTLQVVVGLAEIHRKGFIHRDLKPENIFLATHGSTFCMKVGDFGLVTGTKRPKRNGRTTNVGTHPYAAPEMSGDTYDSAVDVYALGIILFEMFNPMMTIMEKIILIEDHDQWPVSFITNHKHEEDPVWVRSNTRLKRLSRRNQYVFAIPREIEPNKFY